MKIIIIIYLLTNKIGLKNMATATGDIAKSSIETHQYTEVAAQTTELLGIRYGMRMKFRPPLSRYNVVMPI